MAAIRLIGPIGTWVSSHGKSGVGFHTAPRSIAPGQRLRWPRLATARKAASRSSGGTGWRSPLSCVNALTCGAARLAPPSAS